MKNGVFWDVTPCGFVRTVVLFLQEPHGVTAQKTPFFSINRVLKQKNTYDVTYRQNDTSIFRVELRNSGTNLPG
jgi:hypothetical protein